ncbi:MAG: DUF4870 domain-containing protein [Chloroflexi bacterium]|nr:DUF4870 domain-containing protein [Chloroflexota bacterium]
MSQLPPVASAPGDITDNDKLLAALAYFFTPIVPVIILLVDTMKVRPYQKYHAMNALGLCVALILYSLVVCICAIPLSFVGIGICMFPLVFLVWIPVIYYTIIAYAKPAYFEIPVITQFMKHLGWLAI